MSTSYGLYCVDCDDVDNLGGDCRDIGGLQAVIANAAKLAVFADVVHEIALGSYYTTPTLYLDDCHQDPLRLDWLAKHAGHALRVRDEYGHVLDECGERFGCAACGHKASRCRRPIGHAGDHHESRDHAEAGAK